MNLFKKKVKIENYLPVTGRVLMERTEHTHIYKVIDVADNVNYDGSRTKIEKDDLIVCGEYLYSSSFKLNGKEYFTIKPSLIQGTFKKNS